MSDGNEGGSEFSPITSQAEFDKRISARLGEVKRQAAGEIAALQAKVDKFEADEASNKTEAERMAQTIADLTARVDKAETDAIRADIAAAKGLTPAQAKRLTGATREELEADADEILETFGIKPDAGKGKGDDDGAGDGSDDKAGAGAGGTGGAPPSRKPAADLRGGGDPTGAAEKDYTPAELAAMVPRQ